MLRITSSPITHSLTPDLEGRSYIISSITFSRMALNPLAPDLRSSDSLATAFNASLANLNFTASNSKIEEYVELAKILNRQKRVDGLELNISCPNVKKGGMHFGVELEILRDLVTRVRDVTEKTLIVKLTPMVADIRPFAEISQKCGADGVSLINGLVGMAIDIKTRRSKLGRNTTGGLVGPAIRPFALYLVWQAAKSVDIQVVEIGGISSAQDAIEFLIAGASAIEIGTWNFINPGITMEVIDGIGTYMKENKIQSLSELTGSFAQPDILKSRENEIQ